MTIRSGSTRHVILIGNNVYKFPRIPFILFIRRALKHFISQKINHKINEHGIGPTYLFKYFTRGFRANYLESRYSKTNPSQKVIIPCKLILGFIIKQPRGERFSVWEKKWKLFLQYLKERSVEDIDLLAPENYSIWKGEICLHDYGNDKTINFLGII